MPQDLDVHERRRLRHVGRGRAGHPVVVAPEPRHLPAHRVAHGQGAVEHRVVGEQPAVVARDVEVRAPPVHRAEEAAEVLPHRARVVRVAVRERLGERLGRQEPAVLREGHEQRAVEQPLRRLQHRRGRDARVVAPERVEHVAAHLRVLGVERLRQPLARRRRLGQQLGEVAPGPFRVRHHALGAEHVHEARERAAVRGELSDVPPLVGALRAALVVEPHLAAVGHHRPVARQVDGVPVRLVHRRNAPARERAVERVARALALDRHHVVAPLRREPAEHRVRDLPVGLHPRLARERVRARGVARHRRPVAEPLDEDVAQEVGEELGLLVLRGPRSAEEGRPPPEPRLQPVRRRWEGERRHARGQRVGAEERLDVNGHRAAAEAGRFGGGRQRAAA